MAEGNPNDPALTPDPNAVDTWQEVNKALTDYINNVPNATEKLLKFKNTNDAIIASLVTGNEQAIRAQRGFNGSLESSGKAAEKTKGALAGAFDLGQKAIEKMTGAAKIATPFLKGVFSDMEGAITQALNNSGTVAKDLGQIFSSAIPLTAAKMQQSVLQSLNASSGELINVEKDLMQFNKSVFSTGVAFGRTFEDSQRHLEDFRRLYTESLMTIRATPDQLTSVQNAFKNLVSLEDQVQIIDKASIGLKNFKGTVTDANAAILVSAATNTDAATTAGWLAKATTELGDTQDQAILNFGKIQWATKGAGLGFEVVGNSIMNAADALKMWGGTVGSVTPLYKAFSESLAGTGRQGLTPQLLQSYVQGLQGMSFGARAMLGLQVPGGANKGAIGAGLDIEAALEKGPEGMKKVSDSLVAMLKQFGGGRVITREEAIADPAQQRNFMVQRQLLQQQMGLDQATATRTLSMLQSIDKNGLNVGDQASSQLDELLGSGQKAQESTQSLYEKSTNVLKEATLNSGTQIVDSINKLGQDMGLDKLLGNLMNALKTAGGQPGNIDWSKVLTAARRDVTKEQTNERERNARMIGAGRTQEQTERERVQQEAQQAKRKDAQAKLNQFQKAQTRENAGKELLASVGYQLPEAPAQTMDFGGTQGVEIPMEPRARSQIEMNPGQTNHVPVGPATNNIIKEAKRQSAPATIGVAQTPITKEMKEVTVQIIPRVTPKSIVFDFETLMDKNHNKNATYGHQ